jgi:hypothetical protein
MGNVLKNVAVGIAIVAVLQTFGALFELFYRRFFNPSLVVTGITWTLVVVAALVGRYWTKRRYRRQLPIILFSAALFVVAASLGIGTASRYQYHYVPEFDLWTYPPDTIVEDCWKGRGCHEYAINHYGFRGPEPGNDKKTLRLALIGDSWVFCSGVEDGETLAETLDAHLEEAFDQPTDVISTALPGRSIDSFLRQAQYAEDIYDPDAYFVLLKPDDKNTLDLNLRINRTASLQYYGLLVGLNFEFAFNYLTQFGGALHQYNPLELVNKLDVLYDSIGHKRLLLVTSIRGDYRTNVTAWASTKPNVMHLNILNRADWREAERIVNDEHWSEKGVETISKILDPYVIRLLKSEGPYSPLPGQTQPLPPVEYDERPLKNLNTLLACLKKAGLSAAYIDTDSKTVRIQVDPATDNGPCLNTFCCEGGDHYARIGNLCFAVAKAANATIDEDRMVKAFIDANAAAIRDACTYGESALEMTRR